MTDADIDNMIETLRQQRATWEAVERPAAQGDKVNIDYVGRKGGEPFEGGSAEGSDLELGSGRMIPGFEDAIVGMSAGEEKTVPLTFPEDYQSEELKGAEVEFSIKVNSVAEQQLPELNDDFFKVFGVEEGGMERFREEVAANMQRELDKAARNKVKNQVMDGLLEVHDDVQVPNALIEQEIEGLRNQMLQQFGASAQQLDVQSLLPDEMFREQAERRVRLGLVLNEFIARESLTADPDKVRETIEELAATYEDPEQVVNYYYSNQEQLQQVSAMVLEDTAVDKLLEAAQVEDKACSYDEVMSPDPSPEESESASEES